jgi:hypothetical protein
MRASRDSATSCGLELLAVFQFITAQVRHLVQLFGTMKASTPNLSS